jgi:hypothetical protein
MKIFKSLTAVAGLVAIVMTLQGNGCFGGNDVTGVNGGGGGGKAGSGIAYCSAMPNWSVGGGGGQFFCPTSQANLIQSNVPENGFCDMSAYPLGLVGYVPYMSNGGAELAETQSGASASCNNLPGCLGYIMCSRK